VARKIVTLKLYIEQVPAETKEIVKKASASELVELMDNHKITSLDILLTCIERTATIGIQNNYVFDEMFE
jgi:hypothetical protein